MKTHIKGGHLHLPKRSKKWTCIASIQRARGPAAVRHDNGLAAVRNQLINALAHFSSQPQPSKDGVFLLKNGLFAYGTVGMHHRSSHQSRSPTAQESTLNRPAWGKAVAPPHHPDAGHAETNERRPQPFDQLKESEPAGVHHASHTAPSSRRSSKGFPQLRQPGLRFYNL